MIGRDTPLYVRPGAPQRQEMKVFPSLALDTTQWSPTFNLTGTITHVNIIRQADDLAARTGTRVFLRELTLRGYVSTSLPSTATNQLQRGTMFVVYDNAPNGALPVITDILDAADPSRMQRADYRDRFQILLRQHYLLELSAYRGAAADILMASSDSIRNVDLCLPINRPSVWGESAANGAIATMRTGSLLIMWLGTSATATENLVANLFFRLTFTDS